MFRPLRPRIAASLPLVLAAALPAQDAPAPAAPPPPAARPAAAAAPEEMISTLVLRNESVDMVLDLYERWSGRILIRPPSLPAATFTLNLDKPLPKSEAIRAIETLLNRNGVGLAPLGERFTLVSPLNLIRSDAPELLEGSTLGLAPSGRVAAKLFTLRFLRVGEFSPQIQPLLSATIATPPAIFEKTNAMLVVESVANLQRIERLLAEVDRPASADLTIKTYTLSFAKASDVANQIRTLLSGGLASQIGGTTTYQADDRANQLILISDPREQAFFDTLITKLDVRADPSTRSEVVFLKHADSLEVEALLAKLISGQTNAQQSSGATNANRAAAAAAARRANTATPATPAAGGAATPAAAASTAAGPGAEEFSSMLTIVADQRANAIIIAGTPDDIRLVKSLIDRIDVVLPQVRIEVVVVEVNLGDEASSGIDALGLRVENNKLTGFSAAGPGGSIGGIGAGTVSGYANSTGYGQNLSASIGLTTTPRKSRSTILQTPSIVTTHNKAAEIFVGEKRPIITGTTTGASGSTTGLTTSSTISQEQIGITLSVTPLIGRNGVVQLEITQLVQDILGTITIDGNEQPRIGERSTESFVSATNGEIIVLGGLQRTDDTRSTSRLGPIPLLGDLFGSRSRSKNRTELMFFLRPVILTNAAADNVEAYERLKTTPQGGKIIEMLERRPAAAPAPAPADSAPAAPADGEAAAPSA